MHANAQAKINGENPIYFMQQGDSLTVTVKRVYVLFYKSMRQICIVK